MRKRFLNPESKKILSKFSHHVLITLEGNELPKELKIFNGLAAIRIRPFIELVRQCYKYGHLKATCRADKLCLICEDKSTDPIIRN